MASRKSWQGGETQIVDEALIRQAIVNPNSVRMPGYAPMMPTFQGQINEEQVLQLIAYVKSLGLGRKDERQMSTAIADLHETPADLGVNYLNASYGISSWLLTKDHKRIGLLYLGSITFMFFVGGTGGCSDAIAPDRAAGRAGSSPKPTTSSSRFTASSWCFSSWCLRFRRRSAIS